MCAAEGVFESHQDAMDVENIEDTGVEGHEALQEEEATYRWFVAYQDHSMCAAVICTSTDQTEADLEAGLVWCTPGWGRSS